MASRYEQETVINRAGDEDVWSVWSTDLRMIGQIRRLAKRLDLKVSSGTKGGPWVEVLFPASKVRILGPRPERKKLEGHQREVALAHLRMARAGRFGSSEDKAAGEGTEAAGNGQTEGREAEVLLPAGRATS
jgi:hypothetical protein